MRLPIAVLLPVFALLLIAIACKDNGDKPEATASPAGTPQAAATETVQASPTDTPQGDATPSPSDGQVRLALIAANQGGFLADFQDVVIEGKTCEYDQDSLLVDCAANGVYELEKGVEGADAICRVLLVEQQPVGLSCQEEMLAAPVYYEIQ
jgi:hypothetical protein